MDYDIIPVWAPGTGYHILLQSWIDIRPASRGLFYLWGGQPLGAAPLGPAVTHALTLISAVPQAGFFCVSNSPRIDGLSKLVNFQHSKPWIMHRLNWTTEANFCTYFGRRILLTGASGWFFWHLRHDVAAP